MPPKDLFHDTVKRALEKDGWTITHEQLPLSFERLRYVR
ncbi:XisH protein [Calothrix sp. NIES-4071]|nr:XisH protein [Calothrix sp. NIES-4071]BAZ63118.1 XisH protein [Calothrix sp. NIES-4105]